MQHIRKATEDDIEKVIAIVRETMREVYPHYYPQGAVDLFLSYQSAENITKDIREGKVFVLEIEGEMVGTGAIKENRICRLVVKTSEQGKGYGTEIIECLENQILSSNAEILLDASLPACELYRKRGYEVVEYKKTQAANGDFICYPVMRLQRIE